MTTDIEALVRDARGRAAIVGHGTGTGEAYLLYASALESLAAERDRLRGQIRKAHDELTWMAVELGWATDGTLPMAVDHAKEILRVRTAERDAAIKEMHARELHHFEEEQKSAELRAIIDEALASHADAGASQGYLPDGGYGTIDHCCGTCGEFGEYGTPWPCWTARILSRATTTEKGID